MLYSQSPPLAEKQWPGDEEISGELARGGRRRTKPSVDSSYSYRFGEGQAPGSRPSLGRRMVRGLIRFSITVLIGVGATLGWQSYGDVAKEMAVARVPALAWVLPTPAAKSPVAAAATSPGPAQQQLEPLASNLDAVRRSVEQLAYKQEQIAQNIAALQAAQEDVRQKMSATPPAPPPAPAPQAASTPQPKPSQSRAQSSAPRPSPSTSPASR